MTRISWRCLPYFPAVERYLRIAQYWLAPVRVRRQPEIVGRMRELAPSSGGAYNRDKPGCENCFGANDEGATPYLIVDQQREIHVVLVQQIS